MNGERCFGRFVVDRLEEVLGDEQQSYRYYFPIEAVRFREFERPRPTRWRETTRLGSRR
ncbi:hypothetical protein GS429_19080 [Natronorubrum sp. JWXQ-INN-674]|uniref:Uncharacterized protein n=1 Tax=Natronorubrum halalkaliphilum TaxID=2691917 RepID=A0A6B0VR60_9EURY|nr:hypothetical protein [Natronorubrum halalkaliphilum]MXV64130.1 hypothetical protein [Natronorubrum halalkaliphilum]